MEITWLPEARNAVRDIYYFYEPKSSITANEIIEDINTSAEYLAIFPQMAPIEPFLSGKNETFRALLVKKLFKIIYYVDEIADEVVIVTVWDCRQNPEKLTDSVV